MKQKVRADFIANLHQKRARIKGLRQTVENKNKRINRLERTLMFLGLVDDAVLHDVVKYLPDSKSQFNQDIFALSETAFKTGGYFVEFGAADGVSTSNTHLLEKEFGWTGILSEPAKIWHDDLGQNRTAHIDHDCVYSTTGEEVSFSELPIPFLSGISDFLAARLPEDAKDPEEDPTVYQVLTVSLEDLLSRYGAPQNIDFLSIDTEGSEFEILKAHDFDKYRFSIIACEHNFSDDREKIYDLLVQRGYQRKFTEISVVDDWYIYVG